MEKSKNSSDRHLDYLQSFPAEEIEKLRQLHAQNPNEVPASWRYFFDGMSLANEAQAIDDSSAKATSTSPAKDRRSSDEESKVVNLIEAFRQRGHLEAKLDPLGRSHNNETSQLGLSQFGLKNSDKNKKFEAAKNIGLTPSSVEQILAHLKKTYCSSIGVEYMHISDEKTRLWLEKKMEPQANRSQFNPDEKKQFLNDIAEATLFEEFLQKSFTGQKRFSLEGAESLIPALKQIVRKISAYEAKETVIGMAHRGRLNVLVNVMRKPLENIFSEFFGASFSSDFEGSGDVKYHMGYSAEVDVNGSALHMSLGFNPSHLEAIDPVVAGMAKAKQKDKYGDNPSAIVPILIHGDAAVIGQGVVSETLNFSEIDGYCTGGTLHIVINNQIGFTTLPQESRTTLYCTDFAKATQSPILHVNGDDVEAVIHAVTLATEFRQEFHRDVFVDIYSYRKYGHNEGDEPRFTQPQMYSLIGKKKNTYEIYREQLLQQKNLSPSDVDKISNDITEQFEAALKSAKEKPKDFNIDAFKKNWGKLKPANEEDMLAGSSFPLKKKSFDQIVEALHSVPDSIKPLPKFKRMLDTRLKKIKENDTIDWAVAEQLAYGSLIQEGYNVRLSGQDCKRGTFSHRHYEFFDSQGNGSHIPLKKFETENSSIDVYNSPLSEYAVLGFDYGYASSSPNTLTIWEAQFGDFANGAQIMIDQFIASSESKWRRMNGIVMLLPHGYEGQGPEHSSARLERFLQLAGQGNMQVCYPTTPAQFFHLLRRQVMRDFRKPLIVMSPKSPLRMPEVVSSQKEICSGQFENLLISGAPPKEAKKLIFCTGKVYWDLVKAAKDKKAEKETALVRIEQIYPLDFKKIEKIQKDYKNVNDWVWCQEEPKNMGAWPFFRLQTLDMNLPLRYAGRTTSASPATGSPKSHTQELESFLNTAFEK